jgi:hypothetical protein
MPVDYQLYVLAVPRATQDNNRQRSQQNLSNQGLLNNSTGESTAISSDPSTQTLTGNYLGEYARKMAAELRELSRNSTIDAVGLSGRQSPTPLDGYYTAELATVEPQSAQSNALVQYDLTLRGKGTRSTHRRELTTERRELSHPFGNDVTGYVAVPAAAEGVRWLDPETDATADATPSTTRSAELGRIAEYRLSDAPYQSPSLVYDIGYSDEGPTDVRVWDTRGTSKLDGDGNLQWAKVFDPSHEFTAEAIIDNGLVRLRADPSADSGISVQQYDASAGAWASLSLPSSDWTLAELDIAERQSQRLGTARVDAWTRWRDTTTGATYPLDLTVHRGWPSIQFSRVPDSTSPAPSGLESLLSPAASDRIVTPQPVRDLRPREAIR